MEKLKKLYSDIKPSFISLIKHLIIVIGVVTSFFMGRFFENYNSKDEVGLSIKRIVAKNDVNIAVDDHNNLLVIDSKTGEYVIYQDSIGQTIFRLYAKNIFIP